MYRCTSLYGCLSIFAFSFGLSAFLAVSNSLSLTLCHYVPSLHVICLPVLLSSCLFVCLSVCLPVSLSLCLSVSLRLNTLSLSLFQGLCFSNSCSLIICLYVSSSLCFSASLSICLCLSLALLQNLFVS